MIWHRLIVLWWLPVWGALLGACVPLPGPGAGKVTAPEAGPLGPASSAPDRSPIPAPKPQEAEK